MKLSPAPCNRVFAGVITLAAASLLLAACGTAGVGGNAGPPVPAPNYRVGDRWTYHGEQGFRQKIIWDETHEITAVGPDGITVRVTSTGAGPPYRKVAGARRGADRLRSGGRNEALRSGARAVPVSADDGR